jgi:hydroxyquinol 1,2-dioxygenase
LIIYKKDKKMSDFSDRLTQDVLARLDGLQDARFKTVMTSLISHLHAFVRETGLSETEWMQGIRFLTETGQHCDAERQEFILLSDTLGVSMLVDHINHKKPSGATETSVLGPFFVEAAQELPLGSDIGNGAAGTPCWLAGTVATLDGMPIADALVDIWSSDGDGLYDVQRPGGKPAVRARFRTDGGGAFRLWTVKPSSYPIPIDGPGGKMLMKMGRHPYRPAHVHVKISAPGYVTIVTQLYESGDIYLDSDVAFGVKDSLIVDYRAQAPGRGPDGRQLAQPWVRIEHDFYLVPAG